MKKIILLIAILLFLLPLLSKAHTITTIANGNWTNPSTWDCACTPVDGDTINIDHDVVLDFNINMTSGQLTIGSSGSLTEDIAATRSVTINGSNSTSFINNGTVNFNLLYFDHGVITNYGTFIIQDHIQTNQNNYFYNYGTYLADSMSLKNTFFNYSINPPASINRIVILSSGGGLSNYGMVISNSLINHGVVSNFSGTIETSYLENGQLVTNYGSLKCDNLWNRVNFTMYPNSTVEVTNDFYNLAADTVFPWYTALFTNNGGVMTVMDSWYNIDSIRGLGQFGCWFVVADTSYNSGKMSGVFDFCDQTPATSAPFVDINTGYISPNITWCASSPSIGLKEINNEIALKVFPNPAQSEIKLKGLRTGSYLLKLYDFKGAEIKSETISYLDENQSIRLNDSDLPSGIYLLQLSDGFKLYAQKLIVE